MAFGGGFGGFGSTNNNNSNTSSTQGTGFGGFGSANTGGGFGQPQNTGFGANASGTGGGMFGGGSSGAGGGTGFGAGTTTFNAPKPFGNSAATSGSGLFGSNPSTTGASGFGGGFGTNTNNTNNTSTGFGAANTGNTLFGGGNKTGFGSGAATGGGLFGGSAAGGAAGAGATGAFGASSNTGSFFGNSQGTGLGANTQECQGTGSTPFSAYTEKEQNSAVTNHYQSITFMQPYQKFSFEELRLADYNAGRKFGNGSGQAGAFGASTGFGGFGQTNNQSTGFAGSNTFGQQTTSAGTGFGSGTQTAGAFGGGAGAGAGGGLFGQQNKPAGGLFGAGATTTAATGGGVFGTAANSGFGSQQGTGFGAGTGSTLLGNNQNQQKPGTNPFGQNNGTSTGTGFGGGFGAASGPTGGGGLFGNTQNPSQGNPLFGGNQPQSTGNPFGQQNQNQNQNQSSGFGGFGQSNQPKPGGLFGSTTTATGGGLFGQTQNNQQQQQQQPQQQQGGTGLFGQTTNNNNNAGGGLFAPKPAQSGGGLFGQSAGSTTGGGLFGAPNQNQQQQNQGGGLFGSLNNNAGGGLFGPKPAQAGTGLFGSSQQQQQQPNSLFGAQNSQAQGSAFSLGGPNNVSNSFGAQQNDLQGPPALTASALDANPYGSSSIFTGLPPPTQQSPGPIATPISAGQKQKKPAALPQFKINPAMASRFSTPQKRSYGFTYSTYGTPSSVSSSASTPAGMSSSLMANTLGRSLGKSFSTSNLRRTFDTDGDSILSPGAFSANSNRYGTGSLKRLNIDRSLRTDLFGNHAVAALPPPERNEPSRSPSIKKKVSFDASTIGGTGPSFTTSNVVEPDDSGVSTQEQGFTRPRSNGNGLSSPTKDFSQNKELTTVHEDESPQASDSNALVIRDQTDPELGDYWSQPPLAELKSMPRESLKQVKNFEVGRENAGTVQFERPVDLTTVDLNRIFGTIVVIEMRSLTVYPENVKKPPVGRGLNVPSLITLENSWPRQRDKKTPLFEKSGPRVERHMKRLSLVRDTEYVDYLAEEGKWQFRVPHFTTYGLDYDDDDITEQSDVDALDSSMLSEARSMPPPTPAPELSSREPESGSSLVTDDAAYDSSQVDDTFDFKRRPLPPGAFDQTVPFDDEPMMMEVRPSEMSFLGQRSAVLHSDEEDEQDEPSEPQAVASEKLLALSREAEHGEVIDLVGSYPDIDGSQDALVEAGIDIQVYGDGTPQKTLVDQDMNWMEQLQRTISPKKQDRYALRQSQAQVLDNHLGEPGIDLAAKPHIEGGEIATSIDLMNSLFGKEETRRGRPSDPRLKGPKVFEWPYSKPESTQLTELSSSDNSFHASFKPSWSQSHRLTYVANDAPGAANRDVCVMKFERAKDITAVNFQRQRDQTQIALENGVPKARANISSLAVKNGQAELTPAHPQESLVWELASALFGIYDDEISSTVAEDARSKFEHRIRKDRLSALWAATCEDEAMNAVAIAQSAEERAIAYLSANRVPDACAALAEGKDFRLATLVAQIGGDQTLRDDMQAQIQEWRRLNILSEMSDPIRALYELLAGNTCTAVGKKGPVEDRAQSFQIPERFNMDWKRAFGLKLWYGIGDDEPIEEAVRRYAADLQETDIRRPLPFFLVNRKTSLPWKDPDAQDREDVLWGLLDLYTHRRAGPDAGRDLAQVLMPENVVGLPMFHRLSFELHRALTPYFPRHASTVLSDALAVSFATELEAVNQWLWAVFVSLHLSHPPTRQAAIQSLLARNARPLHEGNASVWSTLTDDFKIPERWLWEAMALFARATPGISPAVQLQYLLNAHEEEEAHKVLLETVAPLKIVERDYASLEDLLGGFDPRKPKAWDQGGGLYLDFIKLMRGGLGKKEKRSVVARVVRGLTDAAETGQPTSAGSRVSTEGFLRRVALRDMSQLVGDMVLQSGGGEAKEQTSILQLPLNPETKSLRAKDLSWSHYRKVMAASH